MNFLAAASGISIGFYGVLNALAGMDQMRRRTIPVWAAALLLAFGVILVACGVSLYSAAGENILLLLALGLLGVQVVAVFNGLHLHGKLNPLHHLTRLAVSLLLFTLAGWALAGSRYAGQAGVPDAATPEQVSISAATASVKTTPPAAGTVATAGASPSAGALEAQNWQRYEVTDYGFDFLFPKDWQVTRPDDHHLQVAQAGAVLEIGFRLSGEQAALAPLIEDPALRRDLSTFPFLGEPLPIAGMAADTGGWKAIYFDGGAELARDNLVFTLRLTNADPAQSLEQLSPDALRRFFYIAGSVQRVNPLVTRSATFPINLTQTGLENVESIEIGVFNPQISVSRYLYQHLINDPGLIAELVNALDREVTLEELPQSVPAYELTFNLASGEKKTFAYSFEEDTAGLIPVGDAGFSSWMPVSPAFEQAIAPAIATAEALRENNDMPKWESRIRENSRQVGPFTLEEYVVLDTGRFAPYSFEFKAILPDAIFNRRAGLRQTSGGTWPISPVEVDGHEIEVIETWDPATGQNFAVVQRDGREIFSIPTRGAAGSSPVRGLWAFEDQWVLEVEGHIVIDGQELNDRLGAEETFDWQIIDGKPFAFFMKAGLLHVWYNDSVYPLEYDRVVHNTCCEAGAFDVGHNAVMVWFYAHKDGLWRYVELGRY